MIVGGRGELLWRFSVVIDAATLAKDILGGMVSNVNSIREGP